MNFMQVKSCEEVGELECHITLGNFSHLNLCNLVGFDGWKFTHIFNHGGNHPNQPLLTYRKITSPSNLISNFNLANLSNANLSCIRYKIEVPPWSNLVPDNIAKDLGYFEAHIKVITEEDLALEVSLNEYSMNESPEFSSDRFMKPVISRNINKVRKDGRLERFVTIRSHSLNLDQFKLEFNYLVEYLNSFYEIIEAEIEYVIYDTNLSLDEGWV